MMTKSPLAIMFARTESAAKSMTLSSKLWGHAIMLGWLLIFMVSAVGNAIPASYWIDYRSVMVEDVAYGQMPRVTVDRDIKRSVSGDWWAQLEKYQDNGWSFYCIGNGHANYREGNVPKAGGIPLNEWMNEPLCITVLPVGEYRLNVIWELHPDGIKTKRINIVSNTFKVN
jgi:hypothetical protein